MEFAEFGGMPADAPWTELFSSPVLTALRWTMAAFGPFSILYVLLPRNAFTRRKYSVIDLDGTACALVRMAGIAYAVLFVFTFVRPYFLDEHTARLYHQRFSAPYRVLYLLPPLTWVLGTQVLWSARIRTSRWARLLIGLLLVFEFERFVILVTSVHRDYLPSSWSVPVGTMLVGAVINTVLFTGLALLVHLAAEQWRSRS